MFSRGSGILLHISSLPSIHGIGDLGPEAYRFVDKLQAAFQSYWQVLPLNPTYGGSHNSPYFSSSTAAGNPLLISLELLVEQGLLSAEELPGCIFSPHWVNYPAVSLYKQSILKTAYERFKAHKDSSRFRKFCIEQRSWLDDFALFMVLKQKFNGIAWNLWPEPLKRRNPDALEEAAAEFAMQLEHEKWYQFVFFEQWDALKKYCNERSILIIGDMPIYVSYDSVDIWVNPEIFKLDADLDPVVVSGVPPDYFSETGQLWNNPVYNWDALQESGFRWWIDRMKKMFDRYDIVRIDHFRGLVEYWEIPAGEKTAVRGSWQPVPTYRFFDTLMKTFPGFPVIAEDLGLITDDVRDVMKHYNFPGMKVLLFAFGSNDPLHPYLPHMYERNCFVYTGTHDNNTVRGWFENESAAEDRERVFRYTGAYRSPEAVVRAFVRLAQASVANCAVIPVQDLLSLGSDCRMNQPSVAEGNWKWRLTPDQMSQFPVEWLAEMASSYGRLPKR